LENVPCYLLQIFSLRGWWKNLWTNAKNPTQVNQVVKLHLWNFWNYLELDSAPLPSTGSTCPEQTMTLAAFLFGGTCSGKGLSENLINALARLKSLNADAPNRGRGRETFTLVIACPKT